MRCFCILRILSFYPEFRRTVSTIRARKNWAQWQLSAKKPNLADIWLFVLSYRHVMWVIVLCNSQSGDGSARPMSSSQSGDGSAQPMSSNQSYDGTTRSVSCSELVTMTNTLRAVYLIERWRTSALSSVQLTTRLSRIMCTFLAGQYHSVCLSVRLSIRLSVCQFLSVLTHTLHCRVRPVRAPKAVVFLLE